MYWIIQNNTASEAKWFNMVETLERFCIPFSVHKIIPFAGELLDPPVIDHKNVICMGSYSLRHYAKRQGTTPASSISMSSTSRSSSSIGVTTC